MSETPDHINTDEPEILDEDLEIVSMAGRILGTLRGRLDAATEAFNIAYQNGAHDEVELAGYCEGHEVRDEEFHAEPKPERPSIVVLCGSTRFIDTFREANLIETLAGNIVLSIGCDMRTDAELFAGYSDEELAGVKARLDELHLRKIDLADEVLVLNVGGYIGDSTKSEIDYAISHGKVIRWLEEPLADWERNLLANQAAEPASADDEGDENMPANMPDVVTPLVVDLAQLKEAIDRQPYEPQITVVSPEEYERAKADPRWTGKKTEAADEGGEEPDQTSARWVDDEAERAHYAALGAQQSSGERP